jgi:hypothetical protein
MKVSFVGALSKKDQERHDEVLSMREAILQKVRDELARGASADDPDLQKCLEDAENLNRYLPLKHHESYEIRSFLNTEQPVSSSIADPLLEKIEKRDALIDEIERIGRQDPELKKNGQHFWNLLQKFRRINKTLPPNHQRTFDLHRGAERS